MHDLATKPMRFALTLGTARLRWLDLATLYALATRPQKGAPYMKLIRRALAAWLPLDEYRRRYAFALWRQEQLYQRRVFNELHEQGLIRGPSTHADVTARGLALARLLYDYMPAPISELCYARLCAMLADVRRGAAESVATWRIAREMIREDQTLARQAAPLFPNT